jgi:hypothetical protein
MEIEIRELTDRPLVKDNFSRISLCFLNILELDVILIINIYYYFIYFIFSIFLFSGFHLFNEL